MYHCLVYAVDSSNTGKKPSLITSPTKSQNWTHTGGVGGEITSQGWRDKKFEGYSNLKTANTDLLDKKKELMHEQRVANTVEDEYIHNLQKQIYFLELEMKLLKDKEVETKNKKSGYETLLKDGIPLNEHFIALKNKYNKERDDLEFKINGLREEVAVIEMDNRNNHHKIDIIKHEHEQTQEKFNENKINAQSHLTEIEKRLDNEKNTKATIVVERDRLLKILTDLKDENAHLARTMEKNRMFAQKKDTTMEDYDQKNKKRIGEMNVIIRDLEHKLDAIRALFKDDKRQKESEEENISLMQALNRLERDISITKSKVNELENMREMNLKYISDENKIKRRLYNEHEKLQLDLEHKSKIEEAEMRVLIAESEKTKVITLHNDIKFDKEQLSILLETLKEEESKGRELLDTKMKLYQEYTVVSDDLDRTRIQANEVRDQVIFLKNTLDANNKKQAELTEKVKDITAKNMDFDAHNKKLMEENKALFEEIQQLNQKIDVNNLLKDVDIEELRLLAQNNAMVNQNMTQLIGKWEDINKNG